MNLTDITIGIDSLTGVDESNVVLIQKDNKVLFKIDSEGVITYTLNGELRTMESEKELALIFVQVISGLSGVNFDNKEEIINKIILNWRDGKIDNLLGD